MDGINDSGSHDLKPLDAMNNSGLRMIIMIFGPMPMTINDMNRSELWMT